MKNLMFVALLFAGCGDMIQSTNGALKPLLWDGECSNPAIGQHVQWKLIAQHEAGTISKCNNLIPVWDPAGICPSTGSPQPCNHPTLQGQLCLPNSLCIFRPYSLPQPESWHVELLCYTFHKKTTDICRELYLYDAQHAEHGKP